jgi:hypothetical protein
MVTLKCRRSLERKDRTIIFAKLIVDTEEMKEADLGAGPRAREETKKELLKLIAKENSN